MPRPSRAHLCLAELTAHGGAAESTTLIAASSRAALRACVRQGAVVALGGGWYLSAHLASMLARPPAAPGWHLSPGEFPRTWLDLLAARHAIARARRGALALRSAAAHHGWAVWEPAGDTELALPWGRLKRAVAPGLGTVRVVRRALTRDELVDGVTSPLRTVLDCARDLPFAEALAVADSALRSGLVGADELRSAAARPQVGAARVRRVAEMASGLAANPFESMLRALLLDVQGGRFVPQHRINEDGTSARVDLADSELRIVVEAESHAFHATRQGFERDLWRYTRLTALNWVVLRIGYDQLAHRPEEVLAQVQATVDWRGREVSTWWSRRSSSVPATSTWPSRSRSRTPRVACPCCSCVRATCATARRPRPGRLPRPPA